MTSWSLTKKHVELLVTGDLSAVPDNRNGFDTDQYFNFRVDDVTDEFVIRIARKSGVPPGHTNV